MIHLRVLYIYDPFSYWFDCQCQLKFIFKTDLVNYKIYSESYPRQTTLRKENNTIVRKMEK